jgi:hypothetical protein
MHLKIQKYDVLFCPVCMSYNSVDIDCISDLPVHTTYWIRRKPLVIHFNSPQIQTLHYCSSDVKSQLQHKTKPKKVSNTITILVRLAMWKQCGKSDHKTVHTVIHNAVVVKTSKRLTATTASCQIFSQTYMRLLVVFFFKFMRLGIMVLIRLVNKIHSIKHSVVIFSKYFLSPSSLPFSCCHEKGVVALL